MTLLRRVGRTSIYRLLDRVTERRIHQERLRRERASDFDFFTAITDWHNENAHTRMIGALLEPTGSHGQGILFLKLFLQQCGLGNIVDQSFPGRFQVSVERFIPAGIGGVTQNRYADLVIEGPDVVIVIENKVRAGEGAGQIPDYGRWLAAQGKGQRMLIFLTPEGRMPYERLVKDCRESVQITQMAYSRRDDSGTGKRTVDDGAENKTETTGNEFGIANLSSWLTHCLGHVPLLAPVREVIAQYRKVVDRIGGEKMSKEEIDTIACATCEDSQLFASALAVADAMRLSRAKVQYRFWSDLIEQLGLSFSCVNPKFNSEAEIERYLTDGVRNRPRPGVQVLTDIMWRGEPLWIEIGLLRNTDKNCLTIKLLRPVDSNGSFVDPHEHRIAEAVQHHDLPISQPASPERSFIVGRLMLKDRSELDLTNFDPPAHKLADAEQRKIIVADICEATCAFYRTLQGIMKTVTPT